MTDWRAATIEQYSDVADQLVRYVDLLATVGTERGLIGPREVDRLWERHILNCAVVAQEDTGLIPAGVHAIDVGTGAGLPGMVWAIVRPDITVTLIDSMQRRVDFLEFVVAELELGERVSVIRGRAEDLAGQVTADVVTARAVAPLAKLVGWLAPFVAPGGSILAFKGRSAEEEIVEAASSLRKVGAKSTQVHICGDWLAEPTLIVEVSSISPKEGRRSASHRRR